MNVIDWLDYEIFGNSLLTWGTGLGVFIGLWLLLGITSRVVRARLHALTERSPRPALQMTEHMAAQTKSWFLLLIALGAGLRIPAWPAQFDTLVSRAIVVIVLVQLGLWAVGALAKFLALRREHRLMSDPGAVAAMDVMSFALRVGVWTVVLLLVLDNVGIDITALVAGLGIGGIAVALAAQNILGDLFASLSIILDKPFVVGDFLIIDGYLGTVEKVGIKTTRLRSLSGEQLVFSNNDLLGSRVRNHGRMFERRIVFSIGVTYQTPAGTLKRIPEIIREAVEDQQSVRFDRSHFKEYGDFALIFETVYYVLAADYNLYMDIQQAANLQIFERFEQEGIEFAYPTQSLYIARMRQEPAPAAAE